MALLILIPVLWCGSFLASFFVGFVPPISGRVVDAVTGKPAATMSVCLEARVRDFGKYRALRSEVTQTDLSGKFSFAASLHKLDLLESWIGYSIRVTDPRLKLASPCGAELVWGAFDDGRRVLPTGESDGRVYFPLVFVHEASGPNSLSMGALRRTVGFPFHLRAEMTPLLAGANECQSIGDPSLAGFCREANNSALAGSLRRQMAGSAWR
ncbi:MAG: hypothetical protein ABSG16_04435 [Candidatus Acidiferrum sp.]